MRNWTITWLDADGSRQTEQGWDDTAMLRLMNTLRGKRRPFTLDYMGGAAIAENGDPYNPISDCHICGTPGGH